MNEILENLQYLTRNENLELNVSYDGTINIKNPDLKGTGNEGYEYLTFKNEKEFRTFVSNLETVMEYWRD